MSARALRMPAVVVGTGLSAFLFASVANGGGNSGTVCPRPVGPDVIVGNFHQSTNFSLDTVNGVTYDAFSFGTESCNVGNENLQWYAFSNGTTHLRNNHPAIAQNLFKYKVVNGAGRFEQLGQSWLKHGFTALTDNICGCGCNGAGGTVLGVGCSDPYSASRNAGQSSAGPKWQIDASSGYFPTTNPASTNPAYQGANTGRRLRVKVSDLENSSASVRYFMEGQYVAQDDAAYGNKDNNASYREVGMSNTSGNYFVSLLGTTQREKPGIMAWQAVDPQVVIEKITVPETINPNADFYDVDGAGPNPPVQCCSSATAFLGYRVTDLGDGTWQYEYAIQNLNSHRSIASFSLPISDTVTITDIGFRDVAYYDGDGENYVTYDGTDWTNILNSTEIRWETTPYSLNPNANAIRWGSMYNFRFRANSPPMNATATLGTFRVAGSVQSPTVVPTPIEDQCDADIAGNDNMVNVTDLLAVIAAWGPCGKSCPADINNDGAVGVGDLLAVIAAWGPCP